MNLNKIDMGNAYDRWMLHKKEQCCDDEEVLQSSLRVRFLNCLRVTKITQKKISRITGIPESALSQWKNHKPIGFEKITSDGFIMCPTTLNAFSAGAILIFLEQNSF